MKRLIAKKEYTLQNRYSNNIVNQISDENINKIISTFKQYRNCVKECVSIFQTMDEKTLIEMFPQYEEIKHCSTEYIVQVLFDESDTVADDWADVGDDYGPIPEKWIKWFLEEKDEAYETECNMFGEDHAIESVLTVYNMFIEKANKFIKENKENI